MVRINLKGGIWKNAEDELLKAGVMKYGKQNWSRVASLLNRKSPKQCKARWYEWLDPSIKKTEWSREEEELLLTLAKSLPNQWHTIAPMVGRTATQCIEHFTHLSDLALGKEVDPSDDLRKVRPGEVDPNPEAKPARPDPVDMDEDEKEMLQEARARLANTKGKKAKRKAREKHLEDARRLAQLQKLRELAAAGITPPAPRKKRGEVDDATVIRFHHSVPQGEFDVTEEEEITKQMKKDSVNYLLGKDMVELHGGNRVKREEMLRAKDAKKEKLRQETDLPSYLIRLSELNDAGDVRKRGTFVMPAPQITEDDLEVLGKLGSLDALSKASSMARTPIQGSEAMAGVKTSRDVILSEVRNIVSLEKQGTALEGGENVAVTPMDFNSVTPRNQQVRTQSALTHAATTVRMATGMVNAGGNGGMTSGGIKGPNQTPMLKGPNGMTGRGQGIGGQTPSVHGQGGMSRPGVKRSATAAGLEDHGQYGVAFARTLGGGMTPLRDELGLTTGTGGMGASNVPGLSIKDARVGMIQSAVQARKRLKLALEGLPQAENEYALVWPTLPDEVALVASATPSMLRMAQVGEGYEEDEEEKKRREERETKAQQEAEERRRPMALRKGLPRPKQVNVGMGKGAKEAMKQIPAKRLTEEELAILQDKVGQRYNNIDNNIDNNINNTGEGDDVSMLVRSEVVAMLRRDAALIPVDNKPIDHKRIEMTRLPVYTDAEMDKAKGEVMSELLRMKKAPIVVYDSLSSPSQVLVDSDDGLHFGSVGAQMREEEKRREMDRERGIEEWRRVTNKIVREEGGRTENAIHFLPTERRFGWLEVKKTVIETKKNKNKNKNNNKQGENAMVDGVDDDVNDKVNETREGEKVRNDDDDDDQGCIVEYHYDKLTRQEKDALISSLKQECLLIGTHLDVDRAKNAKLEQGIKLALGGYETRQQKNKAMTNQVYQSLEKAMINNTCFNELREKESKSRMKSRVEEMKKRLAEQKNIEKVLQQRYVSITDELEALVTNNQTINNATTQAIGQSK